MWVVVVRGVTRLSDDKDAVEDEEDVGSGLERPKRWGGAVPVPVVGDGKTVSSLDEIGLVVVGASQPPALVAGGDVDGDGGG